MNERRRFGRLTVELTSTDKVFFPDEGITKGQVVDYYQEIAERMLPYLRGRPIAMARYPDGISGERIFQKNVPSYFPAWVKTAELKKAGGTLRHVICDNAATLVYLANQACIEPHIFLSRIDRVEQPDQLVFDLDPPGQSGFAAAREVTRWLRSLLENDLGLTAFVKTTGGKGLHVHVPLNRRHSFGDVRSFARMVAELLVRRHPEQATIEQRKQARAGRVFVDIMRNAYAQTVVAPFSVRARPAAPVAVPLHWDELDDAELTPQRFTIRTINKRLGDEVKDPWEDLAGTRHDLRHARKLLRELKAP